MRDMQDIHDGNVLIDWAILGCLVQDLLVPHARYHLALIGVDEND